MKKTASVCVNGNVPTIYFRTKRTAAVTCVQRTRRAVFRNTRHLMQKLAGQHLFANSPGLVEELNSGVKVAPDVDQIAN